ncbi:MAG: DHHW family protein [Candidatus Ornithomonoglobus sp.]
MRKYAITFLFMLMLIGSAVVLMCPADTESVLAENREPQEFPAFSVSSVWSGSYMSQIDDYVNDNIGFRSRIMTLSDKIQSCFGFLPNGMGKIISTTKDIGTGESQDSHLVLYDGKIMEMFLSSPEVEEQYADALNTVRKALPDSVKMYSMLIPTQLEFSEPLYSGVQDSQRKAIETVYGRLKNITAVDVYGRLSDASAAGEDYIYFRTDHHWTMNGSYLGYAAFMEAEGRKPEPKEDYRLKELGSFQGSLYLKAKSQLPWDAYDDMFYYDTAENGDFDMLMRAEDGITEYGTQSPVFDTNNCNYNLFFGGDQPLMEITNNGRPDGKTIVIIKDSYANALIPWLLNDYYRLVVIDPRSFGGNLLDEVDRYDADEVAVFNYVLTTTFSDYCEMLTDLLTN